MEDIWEYKKLEFSTYCNVFVKSKEKTKQHYDDFLWMKASLELAQKHTFLEGLSLVQAMYASVSPVKGWHRFIRCDTKLFSKKYTLRLNTFAMNELLGRPVPKVLTLRMALFEASEGNFEYLDRILGFVDSEGKEIQMPSKNDQEKMLYVMDGILLAQGKDFVALGEALAKWIRHYVLYETVLYENYEEFKKKQYEANLEKFYDNLSKSTKKPLTQTTETNKSKMTSKIKIAKDFEHYRKTKRPARL